MSSQAYRTAVLHAATHASSSVHGILTGRQATNGFHVEIVGALPVAHSALACRTSLATETALLLAAEQAHMQGLKLVGAYYASEPVEGYGRIPVTVARMADKLREYFASTCVLVLDPERLASDVRRRTHCFRVHSKEEGSDGSWDKGMRDDSEADLTVAQSALERCDLELSSLTGPNVVADFEDHCLNPSRDWLHNMRSVRN
jgi:Uncharacterised protein family (UPF0172)